MAITEEHYPTNGHGLMVTAIPSMQMEKCMQIALLRTDMR